MNKEKLFQNFGRVLHYIAASGMNKKEIRNLIVHYCETDDILVLVDVLDDLLAKAKKEE